MLDYTSTWKVGITITDDDGHIKDHIEGKVRQPTVAEAVRVLQATGVLLEVSEGRGKFDGDEEDYQAASDSLYDAAKEWMGKSRWYHLFHRMLWDSLKRMPPEDLCIGLTSLIGQMARWHIRAAEEPKKKDEEDEEDVAPEHEKVYNSGRQLEKSAYFYAAAVGMNPSEVLAMPISAFDEAAKQEFRRDAHQQISFIQAISYPHVEDKGDRKRIMDRLQAALEETEYEEPDMRPRWERMNMTFSEFRKHEADRVKAWKDRIRKIRAEKYRKVRGEDEREISSDQEA